MLHLTPDTALLRNPSRQFSVTLPFALLASLFIASILIPLAVMSIQALSSPRELHATLLDASVRNAIILSFEAGAITAALSALLGIPLAWLLSRGRLPGRSIIQTIVDLPLTIPHVVAGIAILFVYGRRGLLGAPLHQAFGLSFWGALPGIVVAMLFVSAPYTVSAARIAFDGVDTRLERVSRSLGVGPWETLWRVVLPLCWRGLLSAVTLSYARAISEFGAVVLVAYYPMTSPVKIYNLFLDFGLPRAIAMSFEVLIVSLCVFLVLRIAAHKRPQPA
ncbi:MAG: ABC transporter permease [Gammaproteobacteria bacterium]